MHHNVLKQYLQDTIAPILPEPMDISSHLVETPKPSLGHLALGTFQLAKALKKAPNVIAAELEAKLASFSHEYFQAKALGPYLNFTFSPKALSLMVLEPIVNGSFFKRKLEDPRYPELKSTMIEYSQPNTHKDLHVGHMRNLSYGNALVHLHRYAGIKVISTTFPGDVGTHVAKCLWYLKNCHHEPIPSENKGAFLGKMYNLASENCPKDAPLGVILQEIEQKSGEYYDLWVTTRAWSIELMLQVYAWAKVDFDKWYWESDVDSASLIRIKKYLSEGKLILSEGAIGADLSANNLGFCMLIKSDGNGLYAAKDVELAFEKMKDFQFTKSIYVVDTRQSHHFAQVFKVLDMVGYPKDIELHHLAYDFVELSTGAMSSRKGNIIPIMDLITNMKHHIKTHYLVRYQGQWDEAKMDHTANIVAASAIKYGMICIDPQKKIIFSMEEWLKIEGNSGPYLLYIQARIASIFRKIPDWSHHYLDVGEAFFHPLEDELVGKLSHFNDVVFSALHQYRPSLLCTYLYELGQIYNSFYVQCPIQKAETVMLTNWRCTLSYSVMKCIQKGLEILGIEYPQEM